MALFILCVGFAGMMLMHGIPEINILFENPIKFANPIGLGEPVSLILTLIGEVVAPILIIIGFKTKLAAIPAFITMFVAAFVVHGKDPMDVKEMAILYFLAFIVIFLAGAGKYAVDGYKK